MGMIGEIGSLGSLQSKAVKRRLFFWPTTRQQKHTFKFLGRVSVESILYSNRMNTPPISTFSCQVEDTSVPSFVSPRQQGRDNKRFNDIKRVLWTNEKTAFSIGWNSVEYKVSKNKETVSGIVQIWP